MKQEDAKIIYERINEIVEMVQNYGTQAKQFAQTKQSLQEMIEGEQKLIEFASNIGKKCDEYLDALHGVADKDFLKPIEEEISKIKNIAESYSELFNNQIKRIDDLVSDNANANKEIMINIRDSLKSFNDEVLVLEELMNQRMAKFENILLEGIAEIKESNEKVDLKNTTLINGLDEKVGKELSNNQKILEENTKKLSKKITILFILSGIAIALMIATIVLFFLFR